MTKPPFSVDAEKATIGAILVEPSMILDVQTELEPSDFYIEKHKLIYDVLLYLANERKAIDQLTVSDELKRREQLDQCEGLEYLNSLYLEVPQEHNAKYYAQIVARTGFNRRLRLAALKIGQLASQDNTESPEDKRQQAESIIMSVCQKSEKKELVHIRDVVSRVYDQTDKRQTEGIPIGVLTGYSTFDTLIGGFQKQDLVYIAGRPGMGKSSLMWCMLQESAFRYGTRSAFFSLEMSAEQLVQRAIAQKSGINSKRIRQGKLRDDEWSLFIDASGRLSETQIFVDDTPALSVPQIKYKLRRLLMHCDIDIVWIDYMQLMQSDKKYYNPVQIYTDISKNLKGLGKEFDIPIVVGSQLSRACEQRNDKRPMLSDLRESGSLEQDADIVIFIYRDAYYDKQSEIPNIAEINTAKNRNGPTGTVELFFKKELTQFVEVEMFKEDL